MFSTQSNEYGAVAGAFENESAREDERISEDERMSEDERAHEDESARVKTTSQPRIHLRGSERTNEKRGKMRRVCKRKRTSEQGKKACARERARERKREREYESMRMNERERTSLKRGNILITSKIERER